MKVMNMFLNNKHIWFMGFVVMALCASLAQAKDSKLVQGQVTRMNKVELEKKFGQVAAVYGQVAKDRQELQTLRNSYMQKYAQNGMRGDCVKLTRKITEATMAYINQRVAETIKKLGPAPTQFSLFTMGSMARDESGFFTDLELGILVAEKNVAVIDYFRRFSQILADRFFLLGEHPDVGGKGLRIDEGDNAPEHLRFYARYASPQQVQELFNTALSGTGKMPYEGARIFVATPQEFAHLMVPNLLQNLVDMSDKQKFALFTSELAKAQKNSANKGLTKAELEEKVWRSVNDIARPLTERERNLALGVFAIARNVRHMYGDKKVFDQYVAARDKYLQGPPEDNTYHAHRREELGYYLLQFDAQKHGKAGSAIATGKLGDTVNIKGSLYRFPEEILTTLGFMYNVGVQNTAQIADKLVVIKRMSPEWGNALKDLMNFMLCLRLRKQMKLGKQAFIIPVTQKGYNDLKQELVARTTALEAEVQSLQKDQADGNTIERKQEELLTAKKDLSDLQKMVPGLKDSILTPEIIKLLNTKYLPLEKKLLETLSKFRAGDRDAFLHKM